MQQKQPRSRATSLQLQLCPDASRFLLLAARASPSVRALSSPLLRAVFPLRSHRFTCCIKLHQVHFQRLQLNCISTPASTPRQFTSHPLRRTATQRPPPSLSPSPSRLRLVSILPLTATPPIRERVSACTSDIIRSICWPVCHDRLAHLRDRSLARSPPHAHARCPLCALSFARSLPISGLQPPLTFFIPLDSIFSNPTLPLFNPSRLLDFVFFVALSRRELKRTLHEPLRQPNRTSNPRRNLSPPPPLSSTLHRAIS